jgi:hypothetical protein
VFWHGPGLGSIILVTRAFLSDSNAHAAPCTHVPYVSGCYGATGCWPASAQPVYVFGVWRVTPLCTVVYSWVFELHSLDCSTPLSGLAA